MGERFDDYGDILSVIEVAHLLGISTNTARDRIRDGSIPSIRMGRRILVPKHALMKTLGYEDAAVDVVHQPTGGEES